MDTLSEFETDKIGQGYLPAYQDIAARVTAPARVCEVGVWRGESLRLWQHLFPGALIAGVDADPRSVWPEGTITVRMAQDDPALPAKLTAISPEWDLIVDDASHEGVVTARTFALLWPLIEPGGWYVIEDWFVGFGKHWQFQGDHSMLRTAEAFLGLLEEQDGDCEFITYRYGMVIIRKAQRSSAE
jgi:hypothetical protein